jgi:hypothetical protein
MTTQLGPKATRIADAIVDLVERTNGAVTLRRVENEIPGFRARGSLNWDVHVKAAKPGVGECVFWDGMSKVGSMALHDVIFGQRVTIQFVGFLNYMLEGPPLSNDNWVPIVLLPAKGANLYTSKILMRVPNALLVPEQMKPEWRVLTPQPLKSDGDLTPLFSKRAPNTEAEHAVMGR